MKILVTGIYGFLGSCLAKKLSEKHSIIGLFNNSVKKLDIENIESYCNLEEITIVPDAIVLCHAAVSSGGDKIANDLLFNSNISLTEKVSKKFPDARIIYISSVSVFGNHDDPISENSYNIPGNEYAISKLWGETVVLQNKNSCVIRFSSLYGDGMKENTIIPNYCNQALSNKLIEVWGDGSRVQNYIYINDAICLIERVIEYKSKIDFIVLGVANKEYSNKQIANVIAELTNSKISYVNQDKSLSYKYNNQLTQDIFNWHSEVEIEIGIKQFIEWKK